MDIIYSKVINEIGEYPFSEIYKKVAELKEKGIKVIDFGVGDPKSPTPDFIIDNLFCSFGERTAFFKPEF